MTNTSEVDRSNDPEQSAAAGPAPSDPPTAESPVDELSALRSECEVLRDKNLRLLADARNLQQRAARDKEEAIRYAEFDFARELLPVLDGLERALKSSSAAADGTGVVDGVRIVYEQFQKILRDHQIEPIDAAGRPFDPAVHEAILQQASAELPPNTVLQEVQRGYRMRDRVLRAARVIVSKSGA